MEKECAKLLQRDFLLFIRKPSFSALEVVPNLTHSINYHGRKDDTQSSIYRTNTKKQEKNIEHASRSER
jgi:hypothetical protein